LISLTNTTDMSTEEVETSPPLTIAALCSAYHPRFHAQHIVDRFLMGYEIDARMHHPLPVVSSYVEMEMEGEASVPGQHQRASLVRFDWARRCAAGDAAARNREVSVSLRLGAIGCRSDRVFSPGVSIW
jgi:hypothetical protein